MILSEPGLSAGKKTRWPMGSKSTLFAVSATGRRRTRVVRKETTGVRPRPCLGERSDATGGWVSHQTRALHPPVFENPSVAGVELSGLSARGERRNHDGDL